VAAIGSGRVQGRTRGLIIEHAGDSDREVSHVETFTCSHCNRVVQVPAGSRWTDVGGMCWSCGAGGQQGSPICARCAKRYVASGHKCESFERKLDEMEAREALRKAVV